MTTNRMEAFSDGVIAIIITIMVLELRPPHDTSLAGLRPLLPVMGSYVMSFIYLGIYWNNHHHLLHATKHIDGRALWANLHLLFWLSLVPFVTAWMGENHFTQWPVALYGAVLLMAAIAYTILVFTLMAAPGNELLESALGSDFKGKVSIVIYVAGIGLSFVNPLIGLALYVAVAVMWLIPDTRIERKIT